MRKIALPIQPNNIELEGDWSSITDADSLKETGDTYTDENFKLLYSRMSNLVEQFNQLIREMREAGYDLT